MKQERFIPAAKIEEASTIEEFSRKLFDELLTEARTKRDEAFEKYNEFRRDVLKTSIIFLATGRDDDLLLEGEKSIWAMAEKNVEENPLAIDYWFWEDRINKLSQYDITRFAAHFNSELEIDAALQEIISNDQESDEAGEN
ncbi:MAG: hypothetical protein H6633_32785 [Anaerolineales bacterium]|nr:hypothetical protein [Anaerolineales bacterium]